MLIRQQRQPSLAVKHSERRNQVVTHRASEGLRLTLTNGLHTPGKRVPGGAVHARDIERREDADGPGRHEEVRAGAPLLLIAVVSLQVEHPLLIRDRMGEAPSPLILRERWSA